MAYVKEWAPRSFQPLELRVPELFVGPGRAVRGDATKIVADLGEFDLAYLDPPYNQHSYRGNYHVWETLVAWDAPEHYGVACKRIDTRDPESKSVFNRKRAMPPALRDVIRQVRARVVILSYNDESWATQAELVDWCSVHGHVEALAFDSKRYVGAQIGIYNPSGEKVGVVNRLRNLEYVVVAGTEADVRAITAPYAGVSTAKAGQQSLFA
jgi:adenine-specific DNA-methyltransferase